MLRRREHRDYLSVKNAIMSLIRNSLGATTHKTAMALLSVLVVMLGFNSPLIACSVCRCGDNAFQFSDQALPLAGQADAQRLRLSLASSYSTKSNALTPDEGPGQEQQHEFRPSVKAVYQLLDHFAVSGELPLSFRHLTVTTGQGVELQKSSGIGDAELTTLWMTNFASANGRYYSAGLSADFKFPTGHNSAQRDGVRMDEHLQGGTGSYDIVVGGALSRSTCGSRTFTSAYYRRNGSNSFDYHYGNAVLFNLGAQRSISSGVIGSLQLNGRHARQDFEKGAIVNNTGGSVAYLTPGIRFGLGSITSLSLSIQIPVWQSLYGDQSEKPVFVTGVNINL